MSILKDIITVVRPFVGHKPGGWAELQIIPRSFVALQNSETIAKRDMGRHKVFEEIDFGT